MYEIFFYASGRGDEPVKAFLLELAPKTRSKVMAHFELLKSHGPWLRRPYADKVRRDLYELRVRFSSDEIRILYAFVLGRRIVLLHAFRKKTQSLKEGDLNLAESRLRDFRERYETKS